SQKRCRRLGSCGAIGAHMCRANRFRYSRRSSLPDPPNVTKTCVLSSATWSPPPEALCPKGRLVIRPTHILNLSCSDQPGIVAAVSTALAGEGANIVESSQFWDQ